MKYYEVKLDIFKPSKRTIKRLEKIVRCTTWESFKSRFYPIFTIKRRFEDRDRADMVKKWMIKSIRKVTKKPIRVYESGYYELE